MIPLVDTHQHLILPDRLSYPWAAGLPALAGRAFTLDDHRAATNGAGIAGTLFMECDVGGDAYVAEAEAVAAIAREPGSGILGLIAGCRPETGVAAWLEQADDLNIRGYRRILHEMADDVSRSETFRASVREIGAADRTFDMVFHARQLPIALELARECPNVLLILDHCGVPDIAGGGLDPWRRHVRDLVAEPNVVAKISGVFAYCRPGETTLAAVRPYVEHVIDAFGPKRCLWGGDWPVVLVAGGTLPGWIAVTREILATLSADEAAAIAHRTAERVYGVDAGVAA